jgi:hypothetical protein
MAAVVDCTQPTSHTIARTLARALAPRFCGALLVLAFVTGGAGVAAAQETWTSLPALPTSLDTSEKPQSKVWFHAHTWWAVLPTTSAISPSGSWLFRLEPNNTWTPVLRLSGSNGRADTKVVGDVTHVLIVGSTSRLVSIEYVPGSHTYQFWSQRPTETAVFVGSTGTIDVDSTGRMWLATNSNTDVEAYYSDHPYSSFSGPVTLATNITSGDIAAVAALPNNTVGVFWSNQNTERFGFRVHVDGANPATWLAEETPPTPAVRTADDHINLAVAPNGTLYAAIKTSHTASTQPQMGLYVRRLNSSGPGGTWDSSLYFVDPTSGTRPIVIFNEDTNKLRVFYTPTGGGNVVVRESDASVISFGPAQTLMSGTLDNATSTKDRWAGRVVILAHGSGTQGVLITTTPGLVGYWKMDEGAGTQARDMSGWGNHAGFVGTPQWTDGLSGLALDLDQTNYALVTDQAGLGPATGLTLAAWVRPNLQAGQDLISKAIAGSVDGYSLSLSPSSSPNRTAFVRFNQATFGDTYRLDSITQYPVSGTKWIHIAATYDGSTMRLYIDGDLEDSMPGPPSIATNALAVGIGAQSDGTNRFRGEMDDVRIYNRALSQAEIDALQSIGPPDADLSITKSNFVSAITAGSSTSYTIQATNLGPGYVPEATITDVVPAPLTGATWTCTATAGASCTASGTGSINDVVSLPAGASVFYTLHANVPVSASGNVANTATIEAADVNDPNEANNSATDVDSIQQPIAPVISTAPADTVVAAPDAATLSVAAAGAVPMTFQWRKNGTPIAGATSATYTRNPSAISDSGQYDVVVSNAYGTATSPAATLTVLGPANIAFNAHFNSGADGFTYLDDLFRGTNQPNYASGVYQPAGGFAGGGLQVQVGGVNGSTIVNMSGGWQRSFTLASPMPVDLFFRFRLTETEEYEDDEFTQMLVSLDGVLHGIPPNDYIAQVVGGGPVTTGWQYVHLSFGSLPAGTHTVALGAYNNQKSRANEWADVVIDDVLVAMGTPPEPPTIITQPSNVTVTAPSAATLSVVAEGDAPLTYQWRKAGAPIDGATGSTYVINPTSVSHSGQYDVVVSNAAGSVTSATVTLTVNSAPVPPSITTQPAHVTVTAPAPATFSVTATGTAPLTYQWRRNGAPIAGATGTSYTLNPTAGSDSGAQFTVVVSNTAGSVTSAAATLTVNGAPVAPAITTPPANVTVTEPSSATFSVAATGTAPLAYQWRRNGTPISGATGSSYTLNPTAVSDSGAQFTVVVTNPVGSVTSSAAALTVNAAGGGGAGLPIDVHFDSGADGFEYADDLFRGTNQPNFASGTWLPSGGFSGGALQVGVGGVNGDTIVNMSGGWRRSFSLATPTAVVLSFRFQLTETPEYETDEYTQMLASLDGVLYGVAPNDYIAQVVGGGPTTTGWQLVQINFGTLPAGNHVLALGAYNNQKTRTNESAEVLIDDVLLTDTVPPSITTQPVGVTVTEPAAASFTVAAAGTAPLTYQWRRNGAPIGGATGTSYMLSPTAMSDNGALFDVVITNVSGSVASTTAQLTVNAAAVAPTITTQPANVTVTAPNSATFSIVANGTAPLGYQWYRNSAPIAGATSASYTLNPTAVSDTGAQFHVVVSNSAGTATSTVATLTVNAAPVPPGITTQPASLTVTAPAAATFSVVANGTAPLGYQWYRSGAPIAGATGSSYTLNPTSVAADNGAQFHVVVSNSAGNATSTTATLTVNAAPVAPAITTHPAGLVVTEPASATFTVAATGTAPLAYQWRRNGTPITGANGPSYTLNPTSVAADHGAQFDVVVSNSVGSATSTLATLTVNTGGGGGGSIVLFDTNFDTGADGFTYADDLFRGTNQPNYASGTWIPSGGFSGGALRVSVGGVNSDTILGMSGGWQRSFTLATPGLVILSFRYQLSETPEYETDEFSQMLVSLDGVLYGIPPNDYIAQVVGGGPTTVGWNFVQIQFGVLPAGTHVLALGAYNNQKTRTNESAQVLIDDLLLVDPVPPSITTQPADVTVTEPNSATFSVAAVGDPPITYQWRRNGVPIPGATSASYVLGPTTMADHGAQFDVVVTNDVGTVTSAPATLTVNAQAPGITTQPAAITVTAPASATFAVVASGTAPLSYQWRRDGTPIPGATGPSYVLDPTSLADDGAQFDVVVANSAGSVTSAVAVLTVNAALPAITTPPADTTVTEPAPAAFSVVATGTAPLSYQWRRNGTPIDGATSSTYVLDPTAVADSGTQFDVVVTNSAGSVTSTPATLTVNPAPVPPSIVTPPADLTVTEPAAATFTVQADGDAPLAYQWRRNGAPIAGATGSSYVLDPTTLEDSGVLFDVVVTNAAGSATSPAATLTVDPVPPAATTPPADVTVTEPASATFTVVATGSAPLSYQWRRNGTPIDGATGSSYVLNPTAVTDSGAQFDVVITNPGGSVTSTAATLTVNPAPPAITTPPASVTVVAPEAAAFSVAASGTAPLSYQWRRDGTPIDGATSTTYVLDPTELTDSGAQFDVVVTNAAGSVTSTAATLTVNAAPVPPSITTEPADVTVTEPAAATFSVVAEGDAPLAYQWRRNGAPIAGATGSSHVLDPTAIADSGAQFDVVITNAAGTITSAAATLTVNPAPPAVTTAPADLTVVEPASATFSVVATGTAPLAYQWRRNGTPIEGATGSSYMLTPTAVSDSGAQFDVVVTNAAGSVTSAAATLTVNAAPPSITTPPAHVTVTEPAAATFSVVASGTAPLSYQWRRNGTPIPGATGTSYVLDPTAVGDSGSQFDVVVTNAGGSVTSAAATLTVNPPPVPPAITTQPANLTVTEFDPATFTVVATGTGPLSYQWRRNGTPIAGATGSSYTLTPTAVSDSGASFDVVVTNVAGSATSSAATLAVNPGGPTIFIDAHFDSGADGFAYADDIFRGTNQPNYSGGNHIAAGGFTGGGLQVFVGQAGGSSTIQNMSGGWQRTFTVASATPVVLSFRFRLAPSELDAGDLAQMLVSLDGVLYGTPPADYIAQAGNGSAAVIEWQLVQVNFGTVAAGTHTLALGGYLTERSRYNEWGEVRIDDVVLSSGTGPVAPGITTQPANVTVTAPAPVTFSVVASGTAPISYQWRRNGVPIAGATGSSYTLNPTAVSDTGAQFTVVVSNSAGSITSAAATLTVNATPVAPSITTQPANVTVVEPVSATFSVVATGTAPLSYQWRRNGASIAGATGASYTLNPTAVADSGAQFDVVVSNSVGSVTSAAATLTVNAAPPAITTQPANVTVTEPASATFSVVAAGTAPFSYQWRRNGTPIAGATGASYTLNPTAVPDSGAQFDVVVSNAGGSVTSAAATLTVNAAPVAPGITTPPANVTVTAPAAATFSVAATGTAPLSYQWRRNGTPIAGATGASYTLNPTAVSDSGAQFDVIVTNAAGSITSTAAALTVNPPSGPTVLIDAHFTAGADGFVYADDIFRGTNQPNYSGGSYAGTGGFAGGGLQVFVGQASGSSTIQNMSGGWQRSFTLSSPAAVVLSFRFRLAPSELDAGDLAQMLVGLDGVLHGVPPVDYIAQVGNGSAAAIGWQQVEINLGTVPAGTHTLALGGYLTERSRYNEWGEVAIDDVLLTY